MVNAQRIIGQTIDELDPTKGVKWANASLVAKAINPKLEITLDQANLAREMMRQWMAGPNLDYIAGGQIVSFIHSCRR